MHLSPSVEMAISHIVKLALSDSIPLKLAYDNWSKDNTWQSVIYLRSVNKSISTLIGA
jgi:hypothetical protein